MTSQEVNKEILTKSNSKKHSNLGLWNVSVVVVNARSPPIEIAGSKLIRSAFWLTKNQVAGVP